ncbi:Pyrroline-5-carboxylate reductase [Thelohanellus kitauei]|uniref:Pyrroline-5-carboxylate reductase 3 n=1 Tax=Thelohanellus kitauei TaxID=669202 RepID=A0A0C2IBT0_THEKT|nr:Pyrroline-5-carboxylate reductase [Thelohanellus kitauei]
MLDKLKIGFIGCGKVAKAFIGGFENSKAVPLANITVSSPLEDDLTWARSKSIACSKKNSDVVKASQIIFLAVLPDMICDIVMKIREFLTHNHILISVAAGVKLEKLSEISGNMKLCRVMLNLQIQSGVGTMALCGGPNCSDDDIGMIKKLLTLLGFCIELPENNFDAFTALAGSGPAFIYGVIESLAEGAVLNGIPRQTAIEIATHMVMGAGTHAWKNIDKYHPCQLREAVCTPGGSSIRGMRALENAGFRSAFISAIDEAVKRNVELGKRT